MSLAKEREQKKYENRANSSTAVGVGGAMGVGLGGFMERKEIKKGFEKTKNTGRSELAHKFDESAKYYKAKEKFANPIKKDLDIKLKDANTIDAKKKLYADADKKMKSFSHNMKPYSKSNANSLASRAMRGMKGMGTPAKLGLAIAGATALSEVGKGWKNDKK